MSCVVTGYILAFSIAKSRWETLELQQCEKKYRTVVERAVSLIDKKEKEFYPIQVDGKVYFVLKDK